MNKKKQNFSKIRVLETKIVLLLKKVAVNNSLTVKFLNLIELEYNNDKLIQMVHLFTNNFLQVPK